MDDEKRWIEPLESPVILEAERDAEGEIERIPFIERIISSNENVYPGSAMSQATAELLTEVMGNVVGAYKRLLLLMINVLKLKINIRNRLIAFYN